MDDLQKQKIELDIAEKELQTKEFLQSVPKGRRILIIALAILIIPMFFLARFVSSEIYMRDFTKRELKARPSVVDAKGIRIIEAQNLRIGNDTFSSYAIIKNDNQDLSASEVKYTFRLYDSSGNEIHNSAGQTYILPAQQKFIILPNVRLSSIPTKVVFETIEPTWQKRIDLPSVILRTTLPEYGDDLETGAFTITGNVENQSTFNLADVIVKGVVLGKSGQVIAVTQTTLNDLKSKESRSYKMFWPVALDAESGGMPQIFAETNILDPSNMR